MSCRPLAYIRATKAPSDYPHHPTKSSKTPKPYSPSLLIPTTSTNTKVKYNHGGSVKRVATKEDFSLDVNAVADATLNLPKIPGGKKLIYTHKDIELTAIDEFEAKGQNNPLFATLSDICQKHNGLWSLEAEQYILKHAPEI